MTTAEGIGLASLAGLGLAAVPAGGRLRRTSLSHALGWAAAAWASWAVALLGWPAPPLRYLALTLTACAGVAVLGARRPGVGAWNFVVGGLLAVLSLPLLEQPWSGPRWGLDLPRAVFLGAILGVVVVNYLPTRWAPAAVLGGTLLFDELLRLAGADLLEPVGLRGVDLLPCLAAVVGIILIRWPSAGDGATPADLDARWRDFRDRYGVVWGYRVMEQLNAALANAGSPARLGWFGLVSTTPGPPPAAEVQPLLAAVLKRFGPA